MTWASSTEEPWSSDAVRQGASPTAQSTSATAPHDRHTTWWWLSATRPSNRAGLPAGSRRRTSPAAVSACRASYTAWREIWPMRSRTLEAITSTPRWSPSRTVSSRATRAAVTRRPAPRSSSAMVGLWAAVIRPTYRDKHERFKTTNGPSLSPHRERRPNGASAGTPDVLGQRGSLGLELDDAVLRHVADAPHPAQAAVGRDQRVLHPVLGHHAHDLLDRRLRRDRAHLGRADRRD